MPKKLWFCTVLFAVGLLLLLTGCREPDKDSGTDTSASSEETETPIVFSMGEETPYVIIQGSKASSAEEQAALTLQKAFKDYLKIEIPVRIDLIVESAGYTESPYEILIGNTNRNTGSAWNENARTKDYCIRKCGEKLQLQGMSGASTLQAVEHFINNFLAPAESKVQFTAADSCVVVGEYAIPSFTVDGAELLDFQLVHDGKAAILEYSTAALAEQLTNCYGYSVSSVASYRADASKKQLKLLTAADAPELAERLGTAPAVLTVWNGTPVLLGKDALSLAEAVKSWCADMGAQGTLELRSNGDPIAFSAPDRFSSMSFNIYGSSDFSKRRNAVLDVVSRYLPDSFGIQEGKQEWINLFGEKLGNIYSCVGEGNKEAGYSETFNNIYYKTDKFNLIEGGTIWLSDDIHAEGSKFAESKRVRTATYALLECKDSGKRVLYVNTHLDNLSATPRDKQVIVLLKLISSFDAPCVLTGDFNSKMDSNVYHTVTSLMQDPRTDAAETTDDLTYNGLGEGWTGVIDYCFFTDDRFELLAYRVNTALYQGTVYPSDHNAVYTEYKIK